MVVEILHTIAKNLCRNCSNPIELVEDSTGRSAWYHDDGGRLEKTCPGSPVAEPSRRWGGRVAPK